MASMQYPQKVVLGDITVRDGFQHEEKFIPTDAKLWVAEHLILAGFKRIELTNFGNPRGMPQFKDADELLKRLRSSKRVDHLIEGLEIGWISGFNAHFFTCSGVSTIMKCNFQDLGPVTVTSQDAALFTKGADCHTSAGTSSSSIL